MGNFVVGEDGNPAALYFILKNGSAKQEASTSGLIALSSDSRNFTDKSGKIEQGYVRCKKPFYITHDNRVFSNSETNVAEKINELKKQGYDCFIFDKTVGDNYMVAVVNKAQIIKDKPTVMYSDRASNPDISYQERSYYNRAEQFSYETLTSKPDMKITVVNDTATYKPTPTIRKNIVNQAIKNASSLGKTNENGNIVIRVDDIDTEVLLSKQSLIHGLDRRLAISAPVILNIGSVLKNSIKINELTPDKESASGSYVLIGYAESANNAYPVRMVVNQYTNEVDTIDVLYAVNTKKETVGKMPGSHGNAALPTVSNISISNLLDFVNKYFPDVLPTGVLKHYGYTQRPGGELGLNALFQERDTDTSNRSLLANALESVAQNDIERNKLAQYKKKISLIESEEQKLSAIQKQLFTKDAVEPQSARNFSLKPSRFPTASIPMTVSFLILRLLQH